MFHFSFLGPPPCTYRYDKLFDFETASELDCFQATPGTVTQSSKTTDPVTVKHGSYSLKWEPRSGSLNPNLKLKFSSGSEIPTNWLRKGGVKVWFYKERPSLGKTLKVEFKNSGILVATFTAHLAFEGWRGVWVKFQECKLTSTSLDRPTKVDEVNFVLREADTIYIDLLQFVRSMAKQSRDKVVPPISPFGLDLYDPSSTWQMTYKWSQQTIPPSPPTIDVSKKISLEMIESRLNNWYCDEAKTTVKFPAGSFLERRWNSLAGPFRKAHEDYDALVFDSSHRVIGPPLFCRNCRYPKKFGEIMEKILFRLSLEYYIRSRIPEIRDTVAAYLNDLNTPAAKDSACKAIAGRDRNMVRKFKSYLPASGPISSEQVENAIKQLNIHRLNKINNLLDYVKQQGLADGSGLGCLDHEWNIDGAGFMHSLFLLKDSLRKPKNDARLLDLIKTAKWYNDFGEIYQSPTFEIKGTTADRMITLMLFRLMIVLIMPSNTDDDFKAKIRDMDALVRWMNNALAVNEGLAGVIKPDFVGHHHKAFYGSAYVPQALHTAALVHYLLEGTAFALSASSENNIRRGLETMRIIAVKYSTPNSVNGRMPNYANKLILKGLLPAFAYISVSHPLTGPSEIAGGCVASANKPEMFLRLYNDPSVNSYLEDGGHKGKYYYNSLGSLDIMEAVSASSDLLK